MNKRQIPKFFICENLELSESTFVMHIFFPRFMIDLIDEEIIWLEDESDEYTQLEYRDLFIEAIDWAIKETDKLNSIRNETIICIQKETKDKIIKNFN